MSTTWTPPRDAATPDVLRRAADIAESDAELPIADALHRACAETGAWHPHVEAVAVLHCGPVEETTAAALREAADQWQATPEHAEHVQDAARDRQAAILTDGVPAWVAEWVAEHDGEVTAQVTPGTVQWLDGPGGEGAPLTSGGQVFIWRGRLLAVVAWADLVGAALGHDVDAARTAVRQRLGSAQ